MTDPKEIARKLRDRRRPLSDDLLDAAADLLDPAPEGPWEPVHDENYWYLDQYGYAEEDLWEDMTADRRALAIGNVYRTREEATRVALRMRAMAKLRRAKGFRRGSYNDPPWTLTQKGSWMWCPRLIGAIQFDVVENAETAWATLTDEERDALLGGE